MHKTENGLLTYIIFFFLLIIQVACLPAQDDVKIYPGAYQTEEYFPLLEGMKTGVVVNKASLLNSTNLVDTLLGMNVDLVKIYSPEHGFKGRADAGASVSDDSYSEKNIPIISLYGNKRKPLPKDLQDVEIMLFDLQDVGVRFYTYISTLHYVMEACGEAGIPLILLDRPNPNGHYIDGPVLEKEFRSFVGMHPVPLVYGMTIGEYAQMINGEYWLADSLQCDLRIIKCRNYDHNSYYKLPSWPSPNLQNMEAIYLYPSTGLFEGTIVSEGRGTEAPFQLIGHPSYSDKRVKFQPRSIEGASMSPKLKGKECYGIDLREISIDSLQSLNSLNLEYLLDFYTDLKLGADFFINYIDLLTGTDEFRKQILNGLSSEEIQDGWNSDLIEFKKIREKYILYPDFE